MFAEHKVLVGAYACHPLRGSEPGVGWNWVRALATHCRLSVITADHQGSRAEIEKVLRAEPGFADRVQFHFLTDFDDVAWREHPFLMRYYQPLYYRYYQRWMWQAYELAQRLVAEQRFDLVHQLTMIGYREPGYLWRLPLPFVWGPIGGTQDVPWRFLPSLGLVEGGRHAARNTINAWQFRTHRRFRQALQRSAEVIVVAPDTQSLLREVYRKPSTVIHEVFTVPNHPQARQRRSGASALRLVFSGLHLSRKGLPFVLHALAGLKTDRFWHLDVLGYGIMTSAWQAEAVRLGLSEQITWHGQVSRSRAMAVMNEADLFVFPSLQEATSTVIAEAISLGLPVVTLNHHGMADFVDDSCGARLAVSNPTILVRDLTVVFKRLLKDRALIDRWSGGALRRAQCFSAEAQIPKVTDLYCRARRGPVPGA